MSNAEPGSLIRQIANLQDYDNYADLHWEGSFEDYLEIVRETPDVTRNAFQRVYDMVLSYGREEYIDAKKKLVYVGLGFVVVFLLTRINPIYHYRAMASAMATAFSTSSSNATLPVTMRSIEENAGVSNRISSFVLPMGATVNMDGTALYECAGVLFISQVLGVELSFSQQFIVVLTALLASIGAAGIPSAGLVMIFIVTQAVGFKDTDVAMIIGTMLAVDRPLDMFRTMVNVTSDSVGTVIIAKSEGETDLYRNLKM